MKNFKEWLKPDDEIKGTFLAIAILIILFLIFYYLILPNISGTSNSEECVPNYMGGCDL